VTDSTINQQVLARAIKDTTFRQALVSNPKAVLAREFNTHYPENVTIRVLEDTSTTFTLVLPSQETMMQELSDADLEAVAGAQGQVTASCTQPYCDAIKTIA
jgi:hypothetical protein